MINCLNNNYFKNFQFTLKIQIYNKINLLDLTKNISNLILILIKN